MSRVGENHLRNQQNAVEKLQDTPRHQHHQKNLVSTTANLKTFKQTKPKIENYNNAFQRN